MKGLPWLLSLLATLVMMAPGRADESASLPGDSVYHVSATLDLADGGHLPFAALAGQPVVVTMFYTGCTVMCPMLTLAMQRFERDLRADSHARFVMISLDDARDTPALLAVFAGAHHLEGPRWILAHANRGDVRALAAALGIGFRRLPDGSFSHASRITLLDAAGRVRATTGEVAAEDHDFLAKLNAQ